MWSTVLTMTKTYDYLFKLLLIGDAGVGKTDIIFKFSEAESNSAFISTIGVDFRVRTIEVDGKKVKLQIWDTAGQERLCSVTSSYYRGANGIMLVYDITDERSFDNIRKWISNVDENTSDDVEKILLGNKCDESDKRQVSKDSGEQLATMYGIKFMEVSGKANINVEDAFFTLARDIKDKTEKKLMEKNVGHTSTLQSTPEEAASNPPNDSNTGKPDEPPSNPTTDRLGKCTLQ